VNGHHAAELVMFSWRVAILQLVALALFGFVVIATPIPLNIAAFVAWILFVRSRARRYCSNVRSLRTGAFYAVQASAMTLILLVAAVAPGKVEDREKSRHITLPKQAMTLEELAEPVQHGWHRFYYCSVNVPTGLADRLVWFPSRELTVGEFISAVEAQTPLRHRFHHCGNGYTILWGGDCSFGLRFHAP
jgi:hypothetical protein